jgi:ABC-2 type transport system ATP-binding protein
VSFLYVPKCAIGAGIACPIAHSGTRRIAVIDAGKVIAEGTPAELKASVGGQRLLLTLADGADPAAAARALAAFTSGSVHGRYPRSSSAMQPGGTGGRPPGGQPPNEGSQLLEVPVTASEGLATEVLRALDAAGVKVTDIAVRTASLDDVFLALTGHVAEEKPGGMGGGSPAMHGGEKEVRT